MAQWVANLPEVLYLRDIPLQIKSCNIAHPPVTYAELLDGEHGDAIAFKFLSPTSFRRKGEKWENLYKRSRKIWKYLMKVSKHTQNWLVGL
ncbi:MAG: hypothetical protein ACHBN1_22690 [Heteroscytonema crispum UTEX LB 1556]